MRPQELIEKINKGALDDKFAYLYGKSKEIISYQRKRYSEAVDQFSRLFPNRNEVRLFSAPGRTEIGGNHTDHQHGCVFAAAVNLDVIAVVSFHADGMIRIKSKGYPQDNISLSDPEVHAEETGKAASIIRGVARGFSDAGIQIDGFDAYTTSDVLSGSGLSSSAAFEILIGTIIDKQYNNGFTKAVDLAKIGQYAENVYFGKASGLMDQAVSAVGGLVFIDFKDPSHFDPESIAFDFENAGYAICVTDTKGSHADLTDDYVSVTEEMRKVAGYFGKEYLREVDEQQFFSSLPTLRETCTDREILRAAHFFDENKRAREELEAIRKHDIKHFLELVRESGESSANYLQNLYSCKTPTTQEIPLALMMSQRFLNGKGAVRVHGGGFAGTIQAFVPIEISGNYAMEMNRIFGENSCYILRLRPVGGTELT